MVFKKEDLYCLLVLLIKWISTWYLIKFTSLHVNLIIWSSRWQFLKFMPIQVDFLNQMIISHLTLLHQSIVINMAVIHIYTVANRIHLPIKLLFSDNGRQINQWGCKSKWAVPLSSYQERIIPKMGWNGRFWGKITFYL